MEKMGGVGPQEIHHFSCKMQSYLAIWSLGSLMNHRNGRNGWKYRCIFTFRITAAQLTCLVGAVDVNVMM